MLFTRKKGWVICFSSRYECERFISQLKISSFSSDFDIVSSSIQEKTIQILLFFIIILQLFSIFKKPVIVVVKVDRYCVKQEPIDISE